MRTVSLLLCLLLVSCHTAPAKHDDPGGVPHAAFVEAMKAGMPPALCKDGGYFRSCFTLSAEECAAGAKQSIESCVAQYESDLPETVTLENMKPWAQRTGGCAGMSFEINHLAQKIHSDDCSNPAKWAPHAPPSP